jgi:ribonuclease P/MRP protein subunit RPP20
MSEEKFYRDPEEYAIFKRLNNKQFSKRPNDIYVTRKTNFKAQLERCMKLISSNGNYREISIYGMGSALQRTINLALQFQLKTNCQLHTTIASLEVTDHLMPLLDDLEPMSDTRWVSTIHIICTLPTILTETK